MDAEYLRRAYLTVFFRTMDVVLDDATLRQLPSATEVNGRLEFSPIYFLPIFYELQNRITQTAMNTPALNALPSADMPVFVSERVIKTMGWGAYIKETPFQKAVADVLGLQLPPLMLPTQPLQPSAPAPLPTPPPPPPPPPEPASPKKRALEVEPSPARVKAESFVDSILKKVKLSQPQPPPPPPRPNFELTRERNSYELERAKRKMERPTETMARLRKEYRFEKYERGKIFLSGFQPYTGSDWVKRWLSSTIDLEVPLRDVIRVSPSSFVITLPDNIEPAWAVFQLFGRRAGGEKTIEIAGHLEIYASFAFNADHRAIINGKN